MTIEILPSSAWWQLESTFEEHGVQLPDPELARILVARDGDTLAGFLVIQLEPRAEPMYIAEPYHRTGLADELAAAAVALYPSGTCFPCTPRERLSNLAPSTESLPWRIYRSMN